MLLTTKFLRPAPDPRTIVRPRLTERVARRPGKRITTVTAPAGYGKTTLVNQWAEQADGGLAWLALDWNDDQPRRFWTHVAGALEQVGAIDDQVRERVNTLDEIALEGALTTLINQLAERASPVTLVIDDYHFIQSPEIHRQMGFLVDYLAPALHLILISRTEPPLPLARWRVRQWLDDIHAVDLAFSEEECHRFFTDYMGLDLAEEESRRIRERTEGWAAAMQLAALSGTQGATPGKEAILSYRGDSKHIADYVLGEILDQQPEPLKGFLLDTVCCNRLCAALCDHLREAGDSQDLLERLVQANLFLIPMDPEGKWYRYHDLFREALLHRLHTRDPERLRTLRQRTADWFLAQDLFQEAVEQLIELEDWERLGRVLEDHGNNLIHEGYHLPVLGWLQSLPAEQVEGNPRLLMLQVWALFFSNKMDVIEPLLERLEDLLDRQVADSHPEAPAALALQSEIVLVRSYLARSRSDMRSASDLTRQVLRDIDHTNIPLKSVTYYGIGLDSFGRGDLEAARAALQSAVEHGKLEKKHSTVLSSGGLLAWILFHQGEMDLALETCSMVRHWVDSFHTDPNLPRLISCWQNSALAEIYRERNDPELARTYLLPLLDHLERGTEPGQHIVIQYIRAHQAFAARDYALAIEALEDAERVQAHKQDVIPFEPPALDAFWARCQLAMGNHDKARHWADHLAPEAYRNPLNREQSVITAARVRVATGEPDAAIAMLNPLRLSTERDGHIKHLIELQCVYALALDARGRREDAARMLEQALRLAARDRFMMLFAEEGPALRPVFQAVDGSALPATYLSTLEAILGADTAPTATQIRRKPDMAELTEPLSSRELEVLDLINQGLANKVIAQKLSVAPTTIKAHIRNLYGKMGVSSRTEALARARQMGLLED